MMSFGGFPGVVHHNDPSDITLRTIYGETWAIDEEALAATDQLEGHPRFYERRKYRTDILDRRAWMYCLPASEGYLNPQHYEPVPTCVWQPSDVEVKFWANKGHAFSA